MNGSFRQMLNLLRVDAQPERKRKSADSMRDLQARQIEGERRLRILQKRAELHT